MTLTGKLTEKRGMCPRKNLLFTDLPTGNFWKLTYWVWPVLIYRLSESFIE